MSIKSLYHLKKSYYLLRVSYQPLVQMAFDYSRLVADWLAPYLCAPYPLCRVVAIVLGYNFTDSSTVVVDYQATV